jgi:hypothetical protein
MLALPPIISSTPLPSSLPVHQQPWGMAEARQRTWPLHSAEWHALACVSACPPCLALVRRGLPCMCHYRHQARGRCVCVLRRALAALCPRARCTYRTARLAGAWTSPVAGLVLAMFPPEGSGASIRKWAFPPHLSFVALLISAIHAFQPVALCSPLPSSLPQSCDLALACVACFSQHGLVSPQAIKLCAPRYQGVCFAAYVFLCLIYTT